MRNNQVMLVSAAALMVIGGAAFQAKATMGGGTDFSALAKSYSPIEKTSCNGQGLFCRAGSTLQCKPLCVCVPCSSPAPVKRHKR
jgi:hypothetical protein